VGEKKGGEVRKVVRENGSELKNFAVWGGGGAMGMGGRRLGWRKEVWEGGAELRGIKKREVRWRGGEG